MSNQTLARAKVLGLSLQAEARGGFHTPVMNGWKIETTSDTFYIPSGGSIRLVGKFELGVFQFRSGRALISVKTKQVRSISNLRSGTAHEFSPLSKFADARHVVASATRTPRHWEYSACDQSMGHDSWDDEWDYLCVCPDGSYAPLGGICQTWVDDWGGGGGGAYYDCNVDPIACLYGDEAALTLPGSRAITVGEYLFCRLFGNGTPYHAVLEKHADGTSICLNDNDNSNGELPMYYKFGGCPQYTTVVQHGEGKLVNSNNYGQVYQSNFTWVEDTGGCNINSGASL